METCARCDKETELTELSSEFGECPECNELTEQEIAKNDAIMDKVAERARSEAVVNGIQERMGRFYE